MPNEQSRANWSAETLRLEILQGEMAEMAKKDAARQAEEKRRADFAADFLRHHIGPEELRHIRQLIEAAVRHGQHPQPAALELLRHPGRPGEQIDRGRRTGLGRDVAEHRNQGALAAEVLDHCRVS